MKTKMKMKMLLCVLAVLSMSLVSFNYGSERPVQQESFDAYYSPSYDHSYEFFVFDSDPYELLSWFAKIFVDYNLAKLFDVYDDVFLPNIVEEFWRETIIWTSPDNISTPPQSVTVVRRVTSAGAWFGTLHRVESLGPFQQQGFWSWTVRYEGWLTFHASIRSSECGTYSWSW